MLREFALADFITLGNGACGMGAVLLCQSYASSQNTDLLFQAMGLLALGFIFDALDGKVARWRRKQSALGAELDSLADIVSFGVAPAALAFAMGMNGGWDVLVLIYFVVCGISRLARFNVTSEDLMTDEGKVSHFEGTPIPTSLALVGVLAFSLSQGRVHDELYFGSLMIGSFSLHPLVLMYALSGSAMISSTLKIPKP